MSRIRVLALLSWVVLLAPVVGAEDVRHEINFPDLPGYQTLVCDFHMHTVFSDGLVWPSVRVGEAWRQGLDAISITDHIEYQPHKDDVPTRHQRPFELAAGPARAANVLLIRGAEITRDTPPGHFNALFLKDITALDKEEFLEVIEEANKQGGFVFWNHQAWKGAEKGRWLDVHTTMYDRGWLQGMEVGNGATYYPDAHQWCLDKNLTMIGNSDIHDADLRTASAPNDHRTMTLVFAKQRTQESIHEALRDRRTLVWFNSQLIGREALLRPFFEACVQVGVPHLQTSKHRYVEVRNASNVDVQLARVSGGGPAELTLPAGTTSMIRVSVEGDKAVRLEYTATNFLVAPETGMTVAFEIGPAASP
jgi:hypothetical protein